MPILSQESDPRIAELNELAKEAGQPLAISAVTIIQLEDAGWVVDPFTGEHWRNPDIEPIQLSLATQAGFIRLVASTEERAS
ncbi:MAG: hypothetical protein M9936_03135 [Caldilinea sp.]|nr:hypothetical protein [Caldilinea sp.]